jgi:hypothetical protein
MPTGEKSGNGITHRSTNDPATNPEPFTPFPSGDAAVRELRKLPALPVPQRNTTMPSLPVQGPPRPTPATVPPVLGGGSNGGGSR